MNFNPALIVAYRQFLSWRTNWRTFLLTRLIEPTIFFYGIGLGFGSLVPMLNGYPYMTFLLPGSVCMATMFVALFEGTYNAYSRAYMQRTWFSFLATPTRISHIMAGELLFASIRNLISVILLIMVGIVAGVKINLLGTLASLPLITLGLIGIVALGYACLSFAKSMSDFDYIWPFLATPMMVFSGTMVHLDTFPPAIQAIAWCLPLTHLIAMVRPLMLEGTLPLADFVAHTGALIAFTAACLWLAHHRLTRSILA